MDISETFYLDNGVNTTLGQDFITGTMVVYGIFSVSGTFSNLFVILTIAANRKLHSLTNIFIAQLAVGDLIILCFCMPFTVTSAYYFKNWIFGYGLCWVVQIAGCAGPTITVLTLAIMSYDRYVGIMRPFEAKETWPRWKAFLVLGTVYALAIFRSLLRPLYADPYRKFVMNSTGEEVTVCSEVPGSSFIFWYHLSGVVLFYFAIVAAAGILYFQIARRLNSDDCRQMMVNNPEAMKKRNRVTKMVFTIVFVIGFTWLPINILMLLYVSPSLTEWGPQPWFVVFVFISRILEYGNCVANPFLYSFLSTNFKSAARETWSKCCPCVSPPPMRFSEASKSRGTLSSNVSGADVSTSISSNRN